MLDEEKDGVSTREVDDLNLKHAGSDFQGPIAETVQAAVSPIKPALAPLCADRAAMLKFLRWRYGDGAAQVVHGDSWLGQEVPPNDAESLLDRVGNQRFYFHVSDLTDDWKDPASHEKGRVTSAASKHCDGTRFIAFDIDAKKYKMTGNVERDKWQARSHYGNENARICDMLDATWKRIGVSPDAIWHSGGGVQGLFCLDRKIGNDEASNLTMRLFMLLGGDPNVSKPTQLLRVPGSVNPKTSDGRVPTVTTLWRADPTITTVEELREALDIGERVSQVEARPAGSPVSDLDVDPRCETLSARAKRIIRDGFIAGESPQHQKDPTKRGAWLWDACWEMAEAGIAREDMKVILKDQRYGLARKIRKKHGGLDNAVVASHRIVSEIKARQAKKAEQHVTRIGDPDWRDVTKGDAPKATVFNARMALDTIGFGAKLDLFHHQIIVSYDGEERVLQESIGEFLTDRAEDAICRYIDARYGFDPGAINLHRSILQLATEHAFDPVLIYLDDVESKWDGVKRLDRAAIDYFGAEDTPLNCAIITATLVGAVRRARQPGAKFDTITVLESSEGFNKSSAIMLMHGKDFFSDQTILGVKDKEAQELLAGVWGFECADLSGIGKADVEHVKAFASRTIDRARPAFGRAVEWRSRRCVIWATTNDDEYLQSQTGNRRFWPIRVLRPIDLERLERDRDQLWAEAAVRESRTESNINIPKSLWTAAAEAQEERRVADPWEGVLANLPEYVTIDVGLPQERNVPVLYHHPDGEVRVAAGTLLTYILRIPIAQQHGGPAKRLATVMKRLGWKRPSHRKVSIDGVPVSGFYNDHQTVEGQQAAAEAYEAQDVRQATLQLVSSISDSQCAVLPAGSSHRI
jgi:hypothetical protein